MLKLIAFLLLLAGFGACIIQAYARTCTTTCTGYGNSQTCTTQCW